MLPVLTGAPTHSLHRDMSFDTLKSHARSRSLHASPLTVAELFDVCGAANELVRNQRASSAFAVVWLGPRPDGARARDAVAPDMAEVAFAACVSADDNVSAVVLWHEGVVAASPTCTDAALRRAHALFTQHDMAASDFFTMHAAGTRKAEWSSTRAAAAVATAARAWCAGSPPLAAVEALPPADAFVVQHDRTAVLADAALADAMADDDDGVAPPAAWEAAAAPAPRPAPQSAVVHRTRLPNAAFNDRVGLFF